MPELHLHPKEGGRSAYGTRLAPTDKIQRGDVYPSDDGTWKPCDPSWIGMEVREIGSGLIVRLSSLPH